jgi:hypothetical protein
VGPGTGLEDTEMRKFLPQPGFELRLVGRTAPSQSLYNCQNLQNWLFNEVVSRNLSYESGLCYGNGGISRTVGLISVLSLAIFVPQWKVKILKSTTAVMGARGSVLG